MPAGNELRALHQAELAHGGARDGGRAGADAAAVQRHGRRAGAHGARLPLARALPRPAPHVQAVPAAQAAGALAQALLRGTALPLPLTVLVANAADATIQRPKIWWASDASASLDLKLTIVGVLRH